MLVDVNLLVYAINQDLPQHKRAKTWWQDTLSGNEMVGLPWVSILAFLRLCTNPRIFAKPLTADRALAYMDEWLSQPNVRTVTPGEGHWAILKNLMTQVGMAGNLTTDAHIAALAMERGYMIYSADNDFKRFPGVRHVNPLDK